MHECSILEEEVELAIEQGIIVKEYPNDVSYPSYLVLLLIADKPLHVVYSINKMTDENQYFIITVYNPYFEEWNIDYKTRRNEI